MTSINTAPRCRVRLSSEWISRTHGMRTPRSIGHARHAHVLTPTPHTMSRHAPRTTCTLRACCVKSSTVTRVQRCTLPVDAGQHAAALPPWVDFDRHPATTMPPVDTGTVLLFTQETAHRVTQHQIPLSKEQKDGEVKVPLELVRSGEYPMLVSRLLHGEPHQSAHEVAMAAVNGDVPARWAHVYTGNAQASTAGAYLQPLLDPPVVDMGTALAACLLRGTNEEGVHAFSANPTAVAWLIEAAASGGGLRAIELAEREPLAAHRARLAMLIKRGRQRLEWEVHCY